MEKLDLAGVVKDRVEEEGTENLLTADEFLQKRKLTEKLKNEDLTPQEAAELLRVMAIDNQQQKIDASYYESELRLLKGQLENEAVLRRNAELKADDKLMLDFLNKSWNFCLKNILQSSPF